MTAYSLNQTSKFMEFKVHYQFRAAAALLTRQRPRFINQMLSVMKLTFILLTTAVLQIAAKGLAQTVSFSGKNVPLQEVFSAIKQQTGYVVLYDYNILADSKPVTVTAGSRPLADFLGEVLKGQRLDFSIRKKTIFIKKMPAPGPGAQATAENQDEQQTDIAIHGVVRNTEGQVLAGANIRVKGTQTGTSTTNAGYYELPQVNSHATLIVSLVGYTTIELPVDGRTVIDIVLKPQIVQQNEVVVIGYGDVKQKDVTGSVATVSPKDFQNVPFTTIDNALAGKAAGVQVTKTDGSPGGGVRIRVRGSTSLLGGNDPLYIIDGVPVQVQSNYINPGFDVPSPSANDVNGSTSMNAGMSAAFVNGLNSLGSLNIDDIESISILKDASSKAIYGSKAANGVVIITTKKGKKDMKPQITANVSSTYTTPITPTLLNAGQYKMLLSEAAENDYVYRKNAGLYIAPQLDNIVNHADTYFGKANTDWLDLVTRNTFSRNAELSVQGGSAASRYYSSLSYNSTPGAVVGSDYQRIAGKLNIDNEIGSRFRWQTNLNLGYVNQDISNGAYGQALRARPDYTPYDSLGNFTSFDNVGSIYSGFQNPVALLHAINNSKTLSLLGSVSGMFDITSHLQFKSTVSLNMQHYDQRNYTPSYLSIGVNNTNKDGIGSNSTSRLNNWFLENTLSYNKTFHEKNNLNVLLGTSYETRKTSFFSTTATGFPNDDVLNNLSSAVTPISSKGDNPTRPQSYLLSFYARVNYDFKSKYLLTFTGRADGSSKFGPNNKFGVFPSGALAWRMSEERFLKNITWLSDLKLRGSFGLTGTQNIGDQMYRTLYTPYSYAGSSVLLPTQLGNPSIQWESTKELDGGIDLSLFNDRLQATFDYYHKQTDGILLSLPVVPSSAYPSLLNNVAGIRNTGYELYLKGNIIARKAFRWSTSLNITWNKSIVTSLNANADLSQIGDLTGVEYINTALIAGKPLGLITGANVVGIIKTQKELDDYKAALGGYASRMFGYLSLGDPMFALGANDGYGRYPLNNLNNQVIGNAAPKFFGGFTQELSYKHFDLNCYFTFSYGGKLMWADHISSMYFSGTSNANAVMLNRWTPQNANSNQPRLILNEQYITNTNLSLFDASYLKLRTVTLNYNFNVTGWMKQAGIAAAAMYASATNVFTITRYPGNDPESSNDPYSVKGGYFDISNFPPVKTITLGVKASF